MMQRNAGFSLVELLCAILILGVGLVGITQGLTTALSSSKESELQTSAALLAAGQIETLRAEGFLEEGTEEGEGEGELSIYRWTRTVTLSGTDGLFEVVVSVEHAKTGAVLYELQTLLFEAPLQLTLGGREAARDEEERRRRQGRGR